VQERMDDERKPLGREAARAVRTGSEAAGGAGRAPADRPGAAWDTAAEEAMATGAGDAAGTPEEAALEPTPDPIAALEMELAAARAEAAACRDSWYRTAADLENIRKRGARELADGQERARAEVLLAMVQVLDDVERALAASGTDAGAGSEVPAAGPADDPIVAGLRLIRGRIADALRRFGVLEIPAAGTEFDPHVHEAVMQAPAAGVPAGHVAHVLERGYRLNERVLRPARVVVA